MKSGKIIENASIKLTSFFMKCVGLWTADNAFERRLRRVALSYTILQCVYSYYLEGRDLCYTWSTGDFVEVTYIASNIFTISLVAFKILVILLHKDEFIGLIIYAQQNFWHSNYDPYERKVLWESGRTCTIFICCFTFFAQCTVCGYMLNPILANIGKNESDRILLFNMWLDLPLAYSPWFEIAFVSETLCTYHIGVCYFCFDNCLCLLCLYTSGQFRILRYRLSRICEQRSVGTSGNLACRKPVTDLSEDHYATLKDCIRMHQDLIEYCERMEIVFSKLALGQVVLFSFLICFTGYQVILAIAPLARRILFTFHNLGDFSQLMMFTYSCGYLMHQSGLVCNAAYSVPWPSLPMDKAGANLRRDVMMMIARSQRPCCITACGFFPVSLETYTAVMSTAASYLALLKRTDVGVK